MQSKKWRAALAHVSKVAEHESCTLESLGEALSSLAVDFEQDRSSALAYIAETAAGSCASANLDSDTVRLAVLELCQRLLVASETSQPFDFANANTELLALLFPQELEQPAPLAAPIPSSTVSADSLHLHSAMAGATGTCVEICHCDDEQLIKEFLDEASEHLRNAEQLMLNLEHDPLNQEAINGVFRAVHSLKGSAGVLELQSLGAISHLAESVLVRVRDGKLVLRGNLFEVILAAVDAISAQVKCLHDCHIAKRTLECPIPAEVLLACLEKLNNTGQCSDANVALLKIASRPPQETERNKKEGKSGTAADTLRVDSKRLEQLIDLVGELVIADAMVQRELNKRENLIAASVATRLRKVVREVQQLSLTLKMIPIGTVFQKMNRLVRDLSAKLNKQIELQIVGAETEVDKTLLECIADPLVHLIRNSIDHGIENSVAERLAAGKPAMATICLKAEHRAGSIHLQISDDGRGLDRARILARAIERGLVDPSVSMTEVDIENLIFAPGFSTASEVTEISGRGVGMDVVRKNVESMRGTISLSSRSGFGTDINLALPLTLSIIDGTVVRTGERFFIIPTLSVVEQVQIAALEFSGSDGCQLVRFRSRFLSVRRLGDVLGTPHATTLKHGQVVMVVESGGKLSALIVDEVLGQQPVVIKPLGGVLAGACYFAGVALLADGQVGFVLDLNAVCGIHGSTTNLNSEIAK